MKRYDLRHLKEYFSDRLFELTDSSQRGEVLIFIFEIAPKETLRILIKNLKFKGHEVMNSLRFNEVDWTIVVKAFVNEPRVSNSLFDAFEKYGVEIKKLDKNGAILCIGTHFSKDNNDLVQNINAEKRELIYMSAQEDLRLQKSAKAYIKYEVGSEAGVLALIAKTILKDVQIPQDVKDYLEDLDEGYLSAESNVGEEEIKEIEEILAVDSPSLLLGCDLYEHYDADLIAGLIALISRFKPLRVSVLSEIELKAKPKILLPPQVSGLKSFDGTIVYFYESDETNAKLYGSSQFAIAAKLKNGDEVMIETSSGKFESRFSLDENMKGTVAVLGIKKSGYRYETAAVSKRGLDG
jgi:NADH-quinone oxidoreductase subunit F